MMRYLGDVLDHGADQMELLFCVFTDFAAGRTHLNNVLALVTLEVLENL